MSATATRRRPHRAALEHAALMWRHSAAVKALPGCKTERERWELLLAVVAPSPDLRKLSLDAVATDV